jgi:hypothetical protein
LRTCAYIDEGRGIRPHDFEPNHPHQKYCAEAHRIAASNARARADVARTKARNAKRRKHPVPKRSKCKFKGVLPHWFTPKRGDQLYCTVEHRKAANGSRQQVARRKHSVPSGKLRCQFKGVKPHWFKPKSRIGKDGVNRGIYPGQEFCSPRHRFSEHSRRWNERHPDSRKKIDARGYERKKKLIALGRDAQAGGRPAEKAAGRPIARTTLMKISLAARLELAGIGPYAMTDQLSPPKPGLSEKEKTATRRKRFHARVDPFLRRYRDQITQEVQRLAALPNDARS